ncbi:MAG: EamA family transporter RarD [Planctomycetes bacterium]|nr:EamA family transporter RarD [Planctomycetota bacterium]
MNAPQRSGRREERVGVAFGLAAFLAWGFVPIYFKQITQVPLLEVLAHRVLWSAILLVGLLVVQRRLSTALAMVRSRRNILTLLATTALIALNWLVFFWAIVHDQVLQGSLGYFINPLFNVVLGFVFLGERLRPRQYASVAIATFGVVYLAVGYGDPPWVALTLAVTFGFYGLLRKTARVDALVGLTVETTFLLPFGIGYLAYLGVAGELTFASTTIRMDVLLMAAGAVTALPLLWFANAARRVRLATLGIMQYIAPSGHFLLAVFLYHEPFSTGHLVCFGCIWAALALYTVDSIAAARSVPAPTVDG